MGVGLGDMAPFTNDDPGYLEASTPLPLAQSPERSRRSAAAALCPVPGTPRKPAKYRSRKPAVWVKISCVTSTNPVTKGSIAGAAFPCQSAGTGRSPPGSLTAGAGPLAGQNPRRQAAVLVRGRMRTRLATGSCRRSQSEFRSHRLTRGLVGQCWPRRAITASGGPCHLPTKPWSGTCVKSLPDDGLPDVYDPNGAHSRVADSTISAHPSRDVARGRQRPRPWALN